MTASSDDMSYFMFQRQDFCLKVSPRKIYIFSMQNMHFFIKNYIFLRSFCLFPNTICLYWHRLLTVVPVTNMRYGWCWCWSSWQQCVTIPKIWPKPNPKLFSDTIFFRYRIWYFFLYLVFLILNPIFFWYRIRYSFDTKFFRDWIQNRQKHGKVLKPKSFETETSPKIPKIWTKPNPKLLPIQKISYWFQYFFPKPNFYDTESDTFFDTKFVWYRIRNHPKITKVSKPRSFETKTSRSGFDNMI